MCIRIFRLTRAFPKDEIYGLTAQIKRAAVSVPSNIAEGYGRQTLKEYIQSLYIAYGSLCELETQLLLSKDLEYIRVEDLSNLQQELGDVERMLKALIKSLKAKLP